MKRLILLTCFVVCSAIQSGATVITFEGFAPADASVNINPTSPHSESGYTLTPSDGESAIFSATSGATALGIATDWFGFAESNVITLTGPAPFDLERMVLGPSTIGGGTINFTIIGQLFGGGSVSVTFNNLTTASTQVIGFTNLSSATFSATDDAAIDDITVSGIPEPATMLLVGTALLSLFGIRRMRSSRS